MTYLGFVIVGLAGTLHCLGMCGPILLAAQKASPKPTRSLPLAFEYQFGRIWSYTILGLAAGALVERSREVSSMLAWQRPLGLVLALATLALGLYFLARGPSAVRTRKRLCPGSLDLRALTSGRPFLVGALTGLIPCSLVYATLIAAATLGSPLRSALAMTAFGLGTAPALAALLVGSHRLPVRFQGLAARAPGLLLLIAGGVLLMRSVMGGH